MGVDQAEAYTRAAQRASHQNFSVSRRIVNANLRMRFFGAVGCPERQGLSGVVHGQGTNLEVAEKPQHGLLGERIAHFASANLGQTDSANAGVTHGKYSQSLMDVDERERP